MNKEKYPLIDKRYALVDRKCKSPKTMVENSRIFRDHDDAASREELQDKLLEVKLLPGRYDPKNETIRKVIPEDAPHMVCIRQRELMKELHLTGKLFLDYKKADEWSAEHRLNSSVAETFAVNEIKNITDEEYPRTLYDYSNGGWKKD